MTNLVLLTTSFPRSEPGSEAAGSFVVDLSVSLGKFWHVTVVAPGTDDTVERWESLNVYRYKTPDKPLAEMRVVHPFDVVNIFRVLRAGQRATNHAIKDTNPEAIIALWALPCGLWAQIAAKKVRIPFIVWCLGSDIWSLGKIPIVKTVLKRVLSSADWVYADGYELAKEVTNMGGNNCEFLPSSRSLKLDKPLPPRSKTPFRLVYVGRWHPNKGTDILLEALSILSSDDWGLIERIDIYGGGVLRDVMEAQVDKLRSIQRPIFLHDYIDKSEAIAAIQRSDWVMIPSRIESIPVIFSDAMQCHRPIICTPVGDLPELCAREEVGVCVNDVSPSALADGIRQALHSNPRQYEKGIKSFKKIFDLDSVALHFRQILTNMN